MSSKQGHPFVKKDGLFYLCVKISIMQKEKKSQEEVKRDLEASRIRFERKMKEVKVKPALNQDSLNIALFGE